MTTALGSKLSSPEATSEALGIENVQEAPNVMQTVRAAEGAVFTTLNMVLMVICATSIVINLVYTQRLYKHVLHGKAFALAYDLQEAMKERKEEWLLRKASRDLGIPLDGEPWVLVEVLEVPVEPGTAPPTSREKNGSTNAAALAAFAARSPYQETPSVPQSPLVTSRSSPALAKESSTPRSPTPRRGLQPSTLAALAVQSKRDYMPWSPSPAPGSRPTTRPIQRAAERSRLARFLRIPCRWEKLPDIVCCQPQDAGRARASASDHKRTAAGRFGPWQSFRAVGEPSSQPEA